MKSPGRELHNWVAAQVGSTGSWTQIDGPTTAQLWRIARPPADLIVKTFNKPEFVEEYPDCAEHAAQAMAHVEAHCDLPIPEVLAVDPLGEDSGAPTLLMTMVPGESLEVPTRRLFDRIVDVAEQIHALPIEGFAWRHHRYNEPADVFAPGWFTDPELFWELAAMSAAAISDHAFIHRDFHPGNLVFVGEQVAGIVDWDYACIGPSGEDYGRTWLNLAAGYGERISTIFASRAARRLDPTWVAAAWLDWLPYYEGDAVVQDWGTAQDRATFEAVGRWATGLS